jgi:hypothetical protein
MQKITLPARCSRINQEKALACEQFNFCSHVCLWMMCAQGCLFRSLAYKRFKNANKITAHSGLNF